MYEKILVIKPSSYGDVIHALPFLQALKNKYPKAEIHWVIAASLKSILYNHPLIDRLWVIEKDKWKNIGRITDTIRELRSLRTELRRERYSLVVDLQGLLRSGVIAQMSGCNNVIGFKEAREGSRFFYTQLIEGGRDVHAVDRYLKVAEFLGCDVSTVSFPLNLSAEPPKVIDELPWERLSREGFVVMVPGARWETKRWPPSYFGCLAALLPISTIIIGSKDDMEAADEVVRFSGGKALSLAGRTGLADAEWIISKAKFMVSNDTGPMHVAAALGVWVYAIFGPTEPLRTAPYGKNNTIIRNSLKCMPCLKKKCYLIECMRDLSFHTVYEIIRERESFRT
ncbi:MAG: lipopolysaccharide heptosyltransferase II [Nitrospirae bacterium]|nr:lipopolysaccharide heptosyltransferase II [Nitrospirota bacterium]MBF0533398.1 lipopolysaccharide heptosyltransferase II [Nitrospirota bacterium]MBF0616076.1 lipopolysaccharide heptosyltransferase II [Nitrospirota bacterium]